MQAKDVQKNEYQRLEPVAFNHWSKKRRTYEREPPKLNERPKKNSFYESTIVPVRPSAHLAK